jgi:hypothetical protein
MALNATRVTEDVGSFGYGATTLTSGTFSPIGRVLAFRVIAVGGDASFNIGGGNTILVREGMGFDWTPRTTLNSPIFTHVSGSLDIFVELGT